MLVYDLPYDEQLRYANLLGRNISWMEEVDMNVYRGCSPVGETIGSVSRRGNRDDIYESPTPRGIQKYCRQGNYIYEGCTPMGPVKYCIDGHYIYEGCTPMGPVKYYLDGNKVYEGCTPMGPVLFTLG